MKYHLSVGSGKFGNRKLLSREIQKQCNTPTSHSNPSKSLARKHEESTQEELGTSICPRPYDLMNCLKIEEGSTHFSRKNHKEKKKKDKQISVSYESKKRHFTQCSKIKKKSKIKNSTSFWSIFIFYKHGMQERAQECLYQLIENIPFTWSSFSLSVHKWVIKGQ